MQKPSLAFARRGDFDNGSLAPIGIAEISKLVDSIDDPVDNFAFPARFRPGSSHALGGMPAMAIGFPRHAGILTDFLQSDVAGARFLCRSRIVFRLLAIGPCRQDRRESFSGVRDEA